MRILGVDPGSRAAGWALVSFDASPRLLAAGVLRPPTHQDFALRLLHLRNALGEIVDREKPDLAAVERVFSGVNPQSLISLGEARGVLLVALAERGVPVVDLTPAEIKRSVTGSGAAEKEQVRRMVASLLGRPLGPLALDAADAAAAALTLGFVRARRGATLRLEAPPAESPRTVRRRPVG